jgi:hypothetical protein
MRQSFLTVVKQMDPTDVLVFKAIYDHGRGVAWVAPANVAIARDFKRSTDEVTVGRLGCISGGYYAPYLMPCGNLLMCQHLPHRSQATLFMRAGMIGPSAAAGAKPFGGIRRGACNALGKGP